MVFRVEPTNRCNQSCKFCFRRDMDYPLGEVDLDKFAKSIDTLDGTHEFGFYWRGEPLLYSGIDTLISTATSRGHSTYIVTNGMLLDQCRLDLLVNAGTERIVFSLDSIDEGEYVGLRGAGSVKSVLQNIRGAASRDELTVVVNSVDYGTNRQSIQSIAEHLLGVVDEVRVFHLSKPISLVCGAGRKCGANESTLYVGWDGGVSPCCFDVNCQILFGVNAYHGDGGLKSVISSSEYQEWLSRFREDRLAEYPVCMRCLS